jgi:signal transduction histidine kinase
MLPIRTYLILFLIWSLGLVGVAQKPIPNTPVSPTTFVKEYKDYLPLPKNGDALTYHQKCWLIALYKASSSLKSSLPPDSALRVMQHTLQLAERYDLQEFIPSIYFQLGNFYSSRADYHKAIEAFYQGIQYFEQNELYQSYLGYPYIDIGNLFYKLHRFNRAEDFYRRANRLFSKDGGFKSNWGRVIALNNIGLCLMNKEAPDSALLHFSKALELRRIMVAHGEADSALLLHSYLYIQKAYRALGNLASASDFLNNAMRLEKSQPPNDEIHAQITLQYAELLYEEENYSGALTYALSALEKADQVVGNVGFHIQVHIRLAQIYLKLQQWGSAQLVITSGTQLARESRNHELILKLLKLELTLAGAQKRFSELPDIYQKIELYQDSLRLKQEASLARLFDFNLELASAKIINQELEESNERIQEDVNTSRLINFLLGAFLLLVLISSIIIYIQYKHALKVKTEEKNMRKRNLNLINSVDNTIICLSLSGEIILINKACVAFYKRVLGIELRKGDNFLNMLAGEHKKALWKDIFERLIESPRGWIDERHIAFDTPMYLQRTITPTFNENGEVDGLIAVGTDVTAAKLQEKNLLEQKKRLDNSDAAKQQMLNLLAHDLKDVVYSSYNLSQLVMDAPEEYERETLLEFFRMLNVNFAKNKDLMESLLAWAKTQVGGVKAQITRIDLSQLVEESLHLMSSRAEEKQIELLSKIHDVQWAHGDYDMIKAVLRNLISNALKFTKAQTGKIVVSVQPDDDRVEISVQDNGLGMSSEQIRKILERPGLSQTEGTDGELGSGFGISICQGYLELNNSSLEIQSKPGKGSTFSFTLPKA